MNSEELTTLFNHGFTTNSLAHAYILFGFQHPTLLDSAINIAKSYIYNNEKNSSNHSINTLECPDVFILNEEPSIKIEHIKKIQEHIKYGPHLLKQSFIIMNNTNTLTPQAANAFLKTLEEPPKNIKFLLLTNNLESILPTIKSRCVTLFCSAHNNSITKDENYLSFKNFKQLSIYEKLNFAKTLSDDKQNLINQCHQWLTNLQEDNITYTNESYNYLLTFLENITFNINIRLHFEDLCIKLARTK